MSPEISVIVPVYNAGNFLEPCLASLKKQSLKEIEFIVIDDGSTDGSLNVCKQFAEEDSRFTVLHQENSGSVSARNAGIAIANGKYIAFVDSDDYVDEDYFSQLLSVAKFHASDITAFAYCIHQNGEEQKQKMVLASGMYAGDTYDRVVGGFLALDINSSRTITSALWGKLFQAYLIKENYKKVDNGLRLAEDLVLNLYCLLCAKSVFVYNENDSFYHYVIHENQITKTFDPVYESRLPVLFDSIRNIKEQYAIPHYEEQMDKFVVSHIYKGFENLFYVKNTLSKKERKKRVHALCSMAATYRTMPKRKEPCTVDTVKNFLVKSNWYMLISTTCRLVNRKNEKAKK